MDNEDLWGPLLEQIEKGSVIPIVGPDLLAFPNSQGNTTYYYADLARKLAEKLKISLPLSQDGLSSSEGPVPDLNAVYYAYMSSNRPLGSRPDSLYGALFRLAEENPPAQPPPALSNLAAIDTLKLFVTTTFDSLLEQALKSKRPTTSPDIFSFSLDRKSLRDLRTPVAESQRPIIYHLFGKFSYSAGTYAMTQGDLLEFIYALQADKPKQLFSELAGNSLLVLGSQFSGWLARFFLRLAKGERLATGVGSSTTTFVADRYIAEDPRTVLFIDVFRQDILVFKNIDPIDFVAELYRRWKEQRKEPPPDPPEPPLVFISYASEDEPVAARIYAALKTKNIAAFFDKDALKGGVNWDTTIQKKIKKCHLFLPIISRSSVQPTPQGRFFLFEWNLGLERYDSMRYWSPLDEDAFLLPVLIDNTAKDDDHIPKKFRGPQWFNLPGGVPTDEFVSRVQQLYRQRQALAAGAP